MVMIEELYDALKSANVPDDKARGRRAQSGSIRPICTSWSAK